MRFIPVLATTALLGSLTAAPAAYQEYRPSLAEAPSAPADVKSDAVPEMKDRFTTSDDQRLGVEVRALILDVTGKDGAKGVFVIIDKGDVQLNGNVLSDEKKKELVEAIKKHKGVKSVNVKLNVGSQAKK